MLVNEVESSVKIDFKECIVSQYKLVHHFFKDLNQLEPPIDIVISDFSLQDMDGIAFCKEFHYRNIPIPCVILLEPGMENRVHEVLDCGANDFIIKTHNKEYLQFLAVLLSKVVTDYNNNLRRQKAELALKESEEKFQKAFMLSPHAIIISSFEEGRIIEINQNAMKLFDLDREELVGNTFERLGVIKPEIRNTLRNLYIDQGYFENIRIEITNRNGEERIFLISGQLITLGGEKCAIQAITDITERSRIEEELLKSRNLESIGILAGGIARDFNNYLTSIMGNISIAKLSLHDTAKIHKSLNRAEEISIKASELAGKLLTFSEGGAPFAHKVSLKNILKGIIDASAFYSTITFHYIKNNSLWNMMGDESQLHQLFNCIISNAIEAMPDGGHVYIDTTNSVLPADNEFNLSQGNYIITTIRDTGKGIPERDLDRIFDPFFSTKNSVLSEGVGLGLTICRSIVKKHNGQIYIDSQVGKGTLVSIYIPAFDEEEPN